MKIKILTDSHSHKDKPVAKGDVIDVSETDAKFLVDIGVAELTTKKEE